MPVVKGLPERPKAENFKTISEYTRSIEKYVDDLENWIDVRAFQDGDDETNNDEVIGDLKSTQKETLLELLTTIVRINETVLKEFIIKRYPHGIGLYNPKEQT